MKGSKKIIKLIQSRIYPNPHEDEYLNVRNAVLREILAEVKKLALDKL